MGSSAVSTPKVLKDLDLDSLFLRNVGGRYGVVSAVSPEHILWMPNEFLAMMVDMGYSREEAFALLAINTINEKRKGPIDELLNLTFISQRLSMSFQTIEEMKVWAEKLYPNC